MVLGRFGKQKPSIFEQLFGGKQAILDDLWDWIDHETNREVLHILDGVLNGFHGVIRQRTRDMGRYPYHQRDEEPKTH